MNSKNQRDIGIPFGLKSGRMVSPSEVESGLVCGCQCPECDASLIAKKGQFYQWHFAHHGAACEGGAETAIHRMAKQILMEEKQVELPAYNFTLGVEDPSGTKLQLLERMVEASLSQYDLVQLEVTKGGRRPDAIGYGSCGGIEHRIEVFVHHAVDSKKAADLEAEDCACFEIFLGDLVGHITYPQLRIAVTAAPERIRWISYPGQSRAREQLNARLQEELSEGARMKDAHDIEDVKKRQEMHDASAAVYRSLEEEHRQELVAYRKRTTAVAKRRYQIEAANQAYKAANEEAKWGYLVAKLTLPTQRWPDVVDTRVKGERSFGVSREIWQADVFRKFIFGAMRGSGDNLISLGDVFSWLLSRYEYAPEFLSAGNVAVWGYFKHLESAGFVQHLARQQFSLVKDIAPWISHESAELLRGWFWSPEVFSCGRSEILAANELLNLAIPEQSLAALATRLRSRHDGEEPETLAMAVSQRMNCKAIDLLDVLYEARAVTNIYRPVRPD